MRIAVSIAELVGNTPLVALDHLATGIEATVLAKIEYLNPGGSSKDRIAAAILDAAEAEGRLKPGGTIVEPTSGNTGVGLALEAIRRGYRTVFVVPEKFDGDKTKVLRALNAEVVITPTNVPPDHPDSYYRVAERLAAEIPDSFVPDQFSNPNAPLAHYATTGPEIWRDTDGTVTHLVVGAATGGTISGTGRYLKQVSDRAVKVIGADPVGSIYNGGPIAPYHLEGVGEDFIPQNYDPSVIDDVIAVSDAVSFGTARALARREGLLVGGSSGMAVAAALQVARGLGPDDVVVVVLPDSGRSYLDKFFDDDWLAERGLLEETLAAEALFDPAGGDPRMIRSGSADSATHDLSTATRSSQQ